MNLVELQFDQVQPDLSAGGSGVRSGWRWAGAISLALLPLHILP